MNSQDENLDVQNVGRDKVKSQPDNEQQFITNRKHSVDEADTNEEIVAFNNTLKYDEKVKSQSENEQFCLKNTKVGDDTWSIVEDNTNVDQVESNNPLQFDEKQLDISNDNNEKFKCCTVNSVSGILQKYSKILR